MLTFASPAWLLGWLLIPVVRWLHRGASDRPAVRVPWIGLWQPVAASTGATNARRPPDPAWRRRAAMTALMFAALASPRLGLQDDAITIWVDDSPSMLVREADRTRLAAGLADARSRLAALRSPAVEVRTLSQPWRNVGPLRDDVALAIAARAQGAEPQVPPAALLAPSRRQWLVTDGADPSLLAWPDGRRPDRIVHVGRVTRNVGIARLSARRDLADPGRLDVLIEVANGGNVQESRDVVLATDGEQAVRSLRLAPGERQRLSFRIDAAASVSATLQPADALREDDRLALDLAALRRHPVIVDPRCASALVAAIAAHPALLVASAGTARPEAAVACGDASSPASGPTLRVVADRLAASRQGVLRWSSAVADPRRFEIAHRSVVVAARLAQRPGDAVLLAVGDEPLIVRRAGSPPIIDVSLDVAAGADALRPEIARMVDLTLAELLGTPLLDATVTAGRGARAANVVPADAAALLADEARAVPSAGARDASRLLLAIAAALLVLELVALARRARRTRAPIVDVVPAGDRDPRVAHRVREIVR